MKRIFAVLLLLLPLLPAREPGGRAHYVGGTNSDLAMKSEGLIQTTDAAEMRFAGKQSTVRVPYENITNIEYGQKVSRRYAEALLISPLMLLAKKRAHFLTVGYTDGEGRQQAMVFQLSQGDVRAVLWGWRRVRDDGWSSRMRKRERRAKDDPRFRIAVFCRGSASWSN